MRDLQGSMCGHGDMCDVEIQDVVPVPGRAVRESHVVPAFMQCVF